MTLKVFISSTHQDLIAHRDRVADVAERLGLQQIRMEAFGARSDEPSAACLKEIDASDAFIGIYAYRYGHVPTESSKSITEAEFDFVIERGIPAFCFLVDEDYPWPPKQIDADPDLSTLRSFKTRIREQLVLDTFTTPDDLALKVGTALGRFMVERSVEEGLRVASGSQHAGTETTQNQVARRAARLAPLLEGARILLVNDNPREMQHVIRILRELNLEVVVATSTDVGLAILEADQFDAVISDMRRGEIADAGTRFIAAMRERGVHRPTIISAGRYKPELGTPPFAFGITNRVDEQLNLLFDILERIRG